MNTDNEFAEKQEVSVMEEHSEENERLDLTKFSKEELYRLLQNVRTEDGTGKAIALIRNIRSHYDHLMEIEKTAAYNTYIENGGTPDDFDLKKEETSVKLEKLFDQLREKISQLNANQEKEKEKNLAEKNALLDRLRSLISAEETNTSINLLKDIQTEWKKIGSVPASYSQELWANYNALVERFYNNRSIYFELKELDRKKNLESKIEICEKSEKLAEVEPLTQAIKELKALHEEYKHIGPVPKEDQEVLWNRFKAASDKVYDRRNEYYEKIKKEQEENFLKKSELVAKIQEFVTFSSDRIDDWKVKTTEVLAIQEEWKKAGVMPLEKSKDISKKFWSSCKTYFHNKDAFFKILEHKKEANLKEKLGLCEQAEQLRDSDDLNTTANTLKELQKKWDAIGPVPIKQKESIFKRFKEACDAFFKKKREHAAEAEKEYTENLSKKEAICSSIEQLALDKSQDPKALKELQDAWNSIGFVPRNDIKSIQEKYNKAINAYIKSIEGDATGAGNEHLRLSLEMTALKNSPDAHKKIHKKEGDVHRRISSLKSEIDRYQTNVDFLGRSKNADLLKQEIQGKIGVLAKELKELEAQLKIIRQS